MAAMPTGLTAQNSMSPKTAIMVHGLENMGTRASKQEDKTVTAYVTITPGKTSWQQLGLTPISIFGNTATVRVAMSKIESIAGADGVEYVQVTASPQPMLDVARAETGVDMVHNATTLDQPYTGKGVIVGIVDAGFDYTHAAFRNPTDGSLRIRKIWEQKNSTFEGAKAPEKYGYGIELDTPELIARAMGDNSENSHGTHVAGIATGSDPYKSGAYRGNAPEADIVLVAVDLESCTSADISNAIAYIYDYADAMDMPCVVNLSLGNHQGPHDGTSTFDTMADAMQGPGRLIVGAAGNHRADKFHISHSFSSADDTPLKTFVTYKTAPSTVNVGGDIEIWGEQGTDFTVDISAYSLFNKKDVVSATAYPNDGVTDIELARYTTGKWTVASETSPLNGKPHVTLSSALTSIRTNHAIAITVTPKTAGRIDIWADNTRLGLDSKDEEGFTAPGESSTIAEIAGTAKRILTVGAYTTRNDYTANGTHGTLNETIGDISSFSSYGPTADGRMKPEISAPGCFIISAVSSNDASGTIIQADSNDSWERNNMYGYMQGTSMSAPFVAGIVATWLQAYPQLTPEQLREVMKSTARKDTFTGTLEEGDNNWGYGKVDALNGLKQCINIATAGCESLETPFDGTITIEGDIMRIAFYRATHASMTVSTLSGHKVLGKTLGLCNAGATENISLAGIPRGIYIVSVTTDGGNKAMKFARQ